VLPTLRIRAGGLFRTDWQLDWLTELIEQWFKDRPQYLEYADVRAYDW
jgi:hypothetical protein